MKRIVITTLVLFGFGCINLFAQGVSFYIQIDDQTLIPESIKDEKSNSITVRSKNLELNDILDKYKFEVFEQAFPTAPTSWLKKIYIVKCDKKELGEELRTKFNGKIPLVEYLSEPLLLYSPNDYGLALGQTNLDLINAKAAWDVCKDLPKINIAVTDTYFDLNHEDLNLTLVGGANSIYVTDSYHGTYVAGCLAATTDNGIGLASVGFNTHLYVSSIWGSDNEVLRLAQAGYRVINCSWQNSWNFLQVSDSIYNLVRNTYNTVCVFAAGNTNYKDLLNVWHYTYQPVYPASYTSNISVTSVGHLFPRGTTGSPANNWKDVHEEIIGDSTTCHHHNSAVDICAPGYNVSTTDIMGSGGRSSGNYGSGWGTSFAAPQVSGTLGLIFSINPCLTANQGVALLLNTADNSIYNIPENSPYIGKLGTGRLNVAAAVNAAAESATTYFEGVTLSGNQDIEDNYAIRVVNNVTLSSGAYIDFITRKEVTIDKNFTVPLGAAFSIDVNVNNVINCN